MNAITRLARAPQAAIEFSNILLTTEDAAIGQTPKDVVWTHRKVTLYRYRSTERTHPVPVLLVFALINRPDIFDLTPGRSFVEFLLGEGFDVFLLDWGVPGEEDADMGVDSYVLDELPWGIRETLRASGEEEVSLIGWCIGGTFCAMHGALEPPDGPTRNMVLLTTTVDTTHSNYGPWVGRESFDVDRVVDAFPAVPGRFIDLMNKSMKPVTNFWSTYRQLWEGVLDDSANRDAYQPMAKWVGNNPPFPARVFREWMTWLYKENRLINGTMRLRDRPVDLGAIEQNLLVVTASSDHITRRPETLPLLERVGSEDVTHLDRPGGHIGLMAGSSAREEIWPDIADWLRERSDR